MSCVTTNSAVGLGFAADRATSATHVSPEIQTGPLQVQVQPTLLVEHTTNADVLWPGSELQASAEAGKDFASVLFVRSISTIILSRSPSMLSSDD